MYILYNGIDRYNHYQHGITSYITTEVYRMSYIEYGLEKFFDGGC